ncbi:hypothetical protein WG66_013237 [Moniliophthora roreri]|nr:hypothetical protein WG66_013237 [Moniliophthora roreri]
MHIISDEPSWPHASRYRHLTLSMCTHNAAFLFIDHDLNTPCAELRQKPFSLVRKGAIRRGDILMRGRWLFTGFIRDASSYDH